MAMTLNRTALATARALINRGRVDKSSPWDFTADDGNRLLTTATGSNDNWRRYGAMHLARRPEASETTKEGWAYPFGKLVGRQMQVYRSGLIAIRSRAAQQNDRAVYAAAGDLIALIDGENARLMFAGTIVGEPLIPLTLEELDD